MTKISDYLLVWAERGHTRIELKHLYCLCGFGGEYRESKAQNEYINTIFSILRTIKPNIKYKNKFFGRNS